MTRIIDRWKSVPRRFGVSSVLAWWTNRPIRRLTPASERAAEGDLTARIDPQRSSELVTLGESFNTMLDTCQRLIERTTTAGVEVNSAAAELSASSDELATTTTQQSAAITQATTTTEELARATVSIADTVDEVARQTAETRDNLEQAEADITTSSERTLAFASRETPDPADQTRAEGRPVVLVEGRPVQVSALAETLGMTQAGPPHGPIVVLADTAQRHAFQVDRLVGQRDVVTGLSRLLPRLPVIAGASVEPDGSVLVVLDPPGLIQRARHTGRAYATPVQPAGFDVRVAIDGRRALARLAEEPSDLVLTDIEMPLMDLVGARS